MLHPFFINMTTEEFILATGLMRLRAAEEDDYAGGARECVERSPR
jgi:hypothetical protein